MNTSLKFKVSSIVFGIILTSFAQQARADNPAHFNASKSWSGSGSGHSSWSPKVSSGHSSWNGHNSAPKWGGSPWSGHNNSWSGNNNSWSGNKHWNNHGPNPLGFLFGLGQLNDFGHNGYRNGPWGYSNGYYDYRGDREYADAIRDSAVIGAIGNVASALIATPGIIAPPAVVYQPAPVVVVPQGHYEIRREKVGGGYYERHDVWVPEQTDPSGRIIEGHNETVRQWVPEVWQETQVWVQPHP